MKKRFCLLVLFSVMLLPVWGARKSDVKMVNFRQDGHSPRATIALKNCTDSTLYGVKGRITFFDMTGEMLDYVDLNERVEIAPGMTKAVELSAYGWKDGYSYYKSEKSGTHPERRFKVKWELTDYSLVGGEEKEVGSVLRGKVEEDDEEADEERGMVNLFGWVVSIWILLLIVLGVVVAVLLWCVIPYKLAEGAGKTGWVWVLLTFFITPFVAIPILGIHYDFYKNGDKE